MIKKFNESPAVKAGHFLKNELKRRGITQEKFAEHLYVDPRTVRRWVKDGVNSVNTLWDIVCFFELENIGVIFSSENDDPYAFILVLSFVFEVFLGKLKNM